MNCLPGYLAIIVKETHIVNTFETNAPVVSIFKVGTIVKTLQYFPNIKKSTVYAGWVIEKEIPITFRNINGYQETINLEWCPDEVLTPLLGILHINVSSKKTGSSYSSNSNKRHIKLLELEAISRVLGSEK